jgi:stage II sporulation protein D
VTTPDQPSQPAAAEEHPVLPSRWHGVAPVKLVWLTAGLVVTALVALSACSSFIPSRATSPGDAAAPPAISADPRYNPSTDGRESEPLIRVRIVRGESIITIGGPETVHILGPSRYRIRARGGSADDYGSSSQVMPTPITVAIGREAWRITDGRGNSRRMPRSPRGVDEDALRITSLTSDMLTIDGKQLPGALWLHGRSGADDQPGSIDVVEHLPIEVYLPGVIAKELYPNWALETFKAQAIAARSYAMHERQRRLSIGSHFDLESTTQDQVYGGATTNPTALKAVEQTYGRILTWNGHILRAYYSSTTGGRAASARDTWPTGPGFEFNLMPPIQATPRDDIDSFSPLFRWEVERDIEELSRRIRTFADSRRMGMRTITQVAKVDPVAFNEFGRPQRYRITEQGGRWWELSAEDTRLAMNHTGDSGLASPTRDQRINSGDFTTRRDGDTLVFSGRGFGHGVGMSQFGAEGMARQGKTAEDILMHYYPGTQLQRAY